MRGALPIAAAASRVGLEGLVVPAANAADAALAGGLPVFGVETLAETIAHLRGEATKAPTAVDAAALIAAAPLAPGDPRRRRALSSIAGRSRRGRS